MSTIVQVCVVVVTIAVVLLAYVAIRVMLRLEATTKKFEVGYAHLEEILEDSRETSKKVRELVGVLEQIASRVRSGTGQIEKIVERAASVGSSVMDEIEPPVRGAVAMVRGLRSGIRALTERWTNGREPMINSREGGSDV